LLETKKNGFESSNESLPHLSHASSSSLFTVDYIHTSQVIISNCLLIKMANNVVFGCFLTGCTEIEHCSTNCTKWSNSELTPKFVSLMLHNELEHTSMARNRFKQHKRGGLLFQIDPYNYG